MTRHLPLFIAAAAALTVSACSDGPTESSPTADPAAAGTIVITRGADAPAASARPDRPSLSDAAAAANLGGSTSTPVTLTPQSCAETASQQVTITYTITGRQVNSASFQVNTQWTYGGSAWSGTVPATVSVPARAATDPATIRQVVVSVTNGSAAASGTSSLVIAPFNLSTSAPAALNVNNANVTIHVEFGPCAVTNTPPALVLPTDFTVEATSSAGATVTYVVTVTDAEESDLTASCSPASGSTFPLGTTTVNCSVTDGGGLTATGSFTVTVDDTTPAYFVTFPTGTVRLVAANINGATLDVAALGITVADVNGVSEPATFDCDYVAGTVLGIGSTTTVTCTATDARNNTSAGRTFDVFVGLNVASQGFLTPLRMAAPFSAHKRGSTIPHKFVPPTYEDGTPATDLASGLNLTVKRLDGTPDATSVDANDYSTGSTAWRYDATEGIYVFNLKTGTSSPWEAGTWSTTVTYKGITLATTQFDLKR